MASVNASRAIAEHVSSVRFEDLPAEAVEAAKKSILDSVGVILAASTLGEGCRPFVELALEAGGKKESTIMGFAAKAPSFMAAFANGSMAHALDYEDTHDVALVHPSAATVPAALAVAEAVGGVSGKALLAAVAVGNDLVCRLGLAARVDSREYGWYMPPILGAFGAGAAAAYLLGLSADKVLAALSLILCQATCSAELVHSPNSDVRAVRDAFSAKAGVLAALLADRGVRGFERPIDGEAGLFASFFRGQYDCEVLLEGLGQVFEGAKVSFKPWPSCRGTHGYIQAMLELREEYGLSPQDVEEIKLTVSPLNRVLCEPLEAKQRPTNAIGAKFSLPFTVGTALVHGRVGLEHFSFAALADEEVLAVAAKVSFQVDHSLGVGESTRGFLEVRAKGQRFLKEIERPYGHPERPMKLSDVAAKFKACAKYALEPVSPAAASEFAESVLDLEKVEDVRTVMNLL
ncbi:MAG: MmgE/PrpD family protein [Moorellales bacterium]